MDPMTEVGAAARGRGADTRAALIAATTRLVAEVGYHAATTKAIARSAGVAEGTIYRHFPDKRALFTAAVLEGQRGVVQWVEGLPERAGTAPLRDLLTEFFTQLSRLREQMVPLEVALAATPELGRPTLSPDALQETVQTLGGPPQAFAEYLAAEQRLGRVRPELDPTRTAVMLLASLFGVQTSPLAQAGGLADDELRTFVEIFVSGVGSTPPGD